MPIPIPISISTPPHPTLSHPHPTLSHPHPTPPHPAPPPPHPHRSGDELVEIGAMPTLMLHLENLNEEVLVRTCGLIYGCCEQVPSVRKALHQLGAVKR